MKRFIETLKQFGIEIPEDKQAEVKKALSEQYKAVEEHNKAISKLETERDNWKQKAETAEQTLEKFGDIKPEEIQTELATWKKKAEDAEENAKKQIYERDFSDALKTELESIEFTSDAAKRDVMSQIKEAGLKLKDGKILGLSDLIGQIKKTDVSAFVDKEQQQMEQNKARFTDSMNNQVGDAKFGTMTIKDIMDIKDPKERQDAIAKNLHVFGQGE